MTDSWEKRPVPYGPGYNNPASTLSFTVTYDEGTDSVVVVASHPVFTALDLIQYQTDQSFGSFSFASWTVDSPTQITIPSATATFNVTPPAAIQQLDFYNAGPVLIGTWTGSEAITAPGVETIGVAYDWGTDTLTLTSPGGNFDANVTDYIFTSSTAVGGNDTYLPLNLPSPGAALIDPNTIEVVGAGLAGSGAIGGFIRHIDVINNNFGSPPGTLIGQFDGFVDATDPDKAYVYDIVAPGNDTVQLDGIRLATAVDGAIVSVSLNTDGGTFNYSMVDPEVISFTDTSIQILDPALDGRTVYSCSFFDGTATEQCNLPQDWQGNPSPAYPIVP